MIIKSFLTEYDENDVIQIEYNYSIFLRWLMKIVYNSERANKEKVTWFENNLSYILGEKHPAKFSVFGEIYVDMSPLGIIPNPALLERGMEEET